MACSNCFNGCAEIVSDQCIRYTGINIPQLGIVNGDTLASVELSISSYLVSVIQGNGVIPTIDPTDYCALVSSFLPVSGNITLNHILSALIQSSCSLQEQVTTINNTLTTLNADYSIACLTGVTSSSDTHNILQAVITKLCSVDSNLTTLASDLSLNYVLKSELNDLIQAYLDSISASNLISNKMVPYTVVEYYGPTSNFSASGAGIGNWIKVYLCNGANGTPDKRGRVGVGVTNIVGGLPFNPSVDPSIAGNPTYNFGDVNGSNTVILSQNQLPSHPHTATATATDTPHFHYIAANAASNNPLTTTSSVSRSYDDGGTDQDYALKGGVGSAYLGRTSTADIDVAVNVVVDPFGGGEAHPNIQPVLACYYIMYIP